MQILAATATISNISGGILHTCHWNKCFNVGFQCVNREGYGHEDLSGFSLEALIRTIGEINCSPDLPFNWSIVKRALSNVASSCWNNVSCKSSFPFISRFGSSLKKYTRTSEWFRQPILYLDALVGLYSKYYSFACLRIQSNRNELCRWTQFFNIRKKLINHLKFCIVVSHS